MPCGFSRAHIWCDQHCASAVDRRQPAFCCRERSALCICQHDNLQLSQRYPELRAQSISWRKSWFYQPVYLFGHRMRKHSERILHLLSGYPPIWHLLAPFVSESLLSITLPIRRRACSILQVRPYALFGREWHFIGSQRETSRLSSRIRYARAASSPCSATGSTRAIAGALRV